jgi:hypothetical protein
MNYKNYNKYKSYHSNIAGKSKSPYYWNNLIDEFNKENDHVVKGLISGWKCVLTKSSNLIKITCTSKKLEYDMRVVIVASMRKNNFFYWDNSYVKVVLSDNTDKIQDNEKENYEEIDISVSVQNDSNNVKKAMNVLFLNEIGAGLSYSIQNTPQLYGIMMDINSYVNKVKSRLILEKVSCGK